MSIHSLLLLDSMQLHRVNSTAQESIPTTLFDDDDECQIALDEKQLLFWSNNYYYVRRILVIRKYKIKKVKTKRKEDKNYHNPCPLKSGQGLDKD